MVVGSHVVAAGIATYRGHDGWYKKFLMPVLRSVTDGETAHYIAVKAAKYGLMPHLKHTEHPELVCCQESFLIL